ncbi:MAG: PA14 domain-containing protein, partial [Acidobacteriota bacterium]
LRPGGIFYTAVTGIWQTVWLEPVPQAHIVTFQTVPDIDLQTITVTAEVAGTAAEHRVRIEAKEGKATIVRGENRPGQPVTLKIPKPHLWSPRTPFLYGLQVSLLDAHAHTIDSVESYFGMRKIAIGRDAEGCNRLLLNNEPLFQLGPLDQGWWPDGLYTAPTDAALRYDLEQIKSLGFNMLRKHVKVEPERLYYWADKLGLLIWQDMPSSNFNRRSVAADALAEADRQWDAELKAMIDHLRNYPSIVMWVPFNEGWGQHDTRRVIEWIKGYDPTRLVNNASGWTDEGFGDVSDIHSYPGPASKPLENNRAVVLGEFGGLGLPIKGHLWKEEGNWGYRSFDEFESYRQKYTDLIVAMYALVKKGLAAAVYTQTTDCEIEVNGLMTYDREVSKLDPKTFATLNRGFLPPALEGTRAGFVAPVQVALQSTDPAAVTRYTLDGTEPTERSARYTSPISIDRDSTLKARNFWPDGTASVTIGRSYRKTQIIMDAVKPGALEPGLAFEFYKSHWTKLPDFEALTPVRKGVAGALDLECAQGEKIDFGLRFTGFIQIPKTDVYVFNVTSDDGSRLRIGGKDVVVNDGVHGMTEVSGEIALEAGWHPIELIYFQGTSGQGLQVTWEGPGFLPGPIPKEALQHQVTQLPGTKPAHDARD